MMASCVSTSAHCPPAVPLSGLFLIVWHGRPCNVAQVSLAWAAASAKTRSFPVYTIRKILATNTLGVSARWTLLVLGDSQAS